MASTNLSGIDRDELARRSAMSESAWAALDERPARVPWRELRGAFIDAATRDFASWIAADQPHFREQLINAAGRFDHGARLLFDLFARGERTRVLDIGAGNGGVSIAFANDPRHVVYALDIVPNMQARALRTELAMPVQAMVGDGGRLPFASNSIDAVLLIDVIEHLRRPAAVAAEIMRVLRPGGRCIVTTPARVPLLFRRDPHYGVPALLLLPNEVQRFVVDRILRMRPAYDVEHIYWHVDEVTRLFPGGKSVDVLYAKTFQPPGRFTWWMLRRPGWAWREIEYRLRGFAFGTIVITRAA